MQRQVGRKDTQLPTDVLSGSYMVPSSLYQRPSLALWFPLFPWKWSLSRKLSRMRNGELNFEEAGFLLYFFFLPSHFWTLFWPLRNNSQHHFCWHASSCWGPLCTKVTCMMDCIKTTASGAASILVRLGLGMLTSPNGGRTEKYLLKQVNLWSANSFIQYPGRQASSHFLCILKMPCTVIKFLRNSWEITKFKSRKSWLN